MSGFIGADIADLRDFAKAMDQASHALMKQAQTLSSVVNQPRGWRGPDADRFRQTWNSSHRPGLATTARSLLEASELLRRNADEQEKASSAEDRGGAGSAGSAGSAGGAGGPGGVFDPVAFGGKLLGFGLGAKAFVDNLANHTKFLADKQWKQFGQAYSAFKNFQADGGLLAKFGKAGELLGKTGKAIGAFSRFAGPVLAPLGIVSGIRDMFNPDHDGVRGTLDRVAGGLAVVGSVGSILIAVGAVANPVGVAVLIGAGVVAGGWAIGNMIADSAWGKAAGKWIGDKATQGWNNAAAAVGNVAGGVKDAVGGAIDGAKSFLSNPVKSLGGLFA